MTCKNKQIIRIPSDAIIDIILTDGNGVIMSPSGRHTDISLKVGRQEYGAVCNDLGKEYTNCILDTRNMKVVEMSDGRFRIPESDEDDSVILDREVECISVTVPAGTFVAGGTLDIALCDITDNGRFSDGSQAVWGEYEVTGVKYSER